MKLDYKRSEKAGLEVALQSGILLRVTPEHSGFFQAAVKRSCPAAVTQRRALVWSHLLFACTKMLQWSLRKSQRFVRLSNRQGFLMFRSSSSHRLLYNFIFAQTKVSKCQQQRNKVLSNTSARILPRRPAGVSALGRPIHLRENLMAVRACQSSNSLVRMPDEEVVKHDDRKVR